MMRPAEFWNALAPHHARIENSYFDLPSLRRIAGEIQRPVLVVGAGQGLIVAELRKNGGQCDGVDFSEEMIRHARIRRGLALIHADAKALPFEAGAYRTIIYATGVVDFTGDDREIALMMDEARRVVDRSGKIFVAFYRLSAATEDFLVRLGLLQGNVLHHRASMEIHRLNPLRALRWVAQRAKVGPCSAAVWMLRAWACSTRQEKRNAFEMRKIFTKKQPGDDLMLRASEQQPYRNEAEIRNLFMRLAIPIQKLETFESCFVAQI